MTCTVHIFMQGFLFPGRRGVGTMPLHPAPLFLTIDTCSSRKSTPMSDAFFHSPRKHVSRPVSICLGKVHA